MQRAVARLVVQPVLQLQQLLFKMLVNGRSSVNGQEVAVKVRC
jgi:hypothetical protein